MREYQLRQKARYDYIWISPRDELILLMPFVNSDGNIGRDNTCKTTEALRNFFIKGHESLEAIKRDLTHDIIVLEKAHRRFESLLKTKQAQLSQAQNYLEKLHIVMATQDIDCFVEKYIPESQKPLSHYLKSLRGGWDTWYDALCPQEEDNWVIGPNVIFSLKGHNRWGEKPSSSALA